MGLFGTIADNLSKIQLNKIYQDVFSEANIQKWIIDTIQNRLHDTGVDGKGSKLSTDRGDPYTLYTTKKKQKRGQPTGHVTLYDRGQFYDSMKVMLNLFGFETDANFEKANGNMYKNFTQSYGSQAKFSADVMSLTDAELNNLLVNKAIPLIGEKIIEQML